MIFSVDTDEGELEHHDEEDLSSLGVLERRDIQEWAIEEPQLLGEELLVVSSEYAGFERTRDRLDILALDSDGKLVGYDYWHLPDSEETLSELRE